MKRYSRPHAPHSNAGVGFSACSPFRAIGHAMVVHVMPDRMPSALPLSSMPLEPDSCKYDNSGHAASGYNVLRIVVIRYSANKHVAI